MWVGFVFLWGFFFGGGGIVMQELCEGRYWYVWIGLGFLLFTHKYR